MPDEPNKLKVKLPFLSVDASGRFTIAAMLALCAMLAVGRVLSYW